MEKDLSFIVLVIACLFLLILFVYSFRTRIKSESTELPVNYFEDSSEDNYDVLTQPKQFQQSNDTTTSAPTPKELSIKKEPVAKEQNTQLLALNILPAKSRMFGGEQVLCALKGANLIFGPMHIFHCFSSEEPESEVLFSVAQAVEPGTFDLDRLVTQQAVGLTVFMQLKKACHNLEAFELMIQTAQKLADELGGVLVSLNKKALSSDTMRQFKKQVMNHLQRLDNHA